jgi:DNA primase
MVLQIFHEYRNHLLQRQAIDKNFFIYHPDTKLSTFAVSLFEFRYQQSHHWKSDKNSSAGYQEKLFHQDFKTFMRTVDKDNSAELEKFLNIEKDRSHEEVLSAITYLKLKKVKKLLLQNQADMEKASPTEQMTLFLTHHHLKQMEMELTGKLGSVIVK